MIERRKLSEDGWTSKNLVFYLEKGKRKKVKCRVKHRMINRECLVPMFYSRSRVRIERIESSSFFCRDPLTSTNANGRRAKAKLSRYSRHSNPRRKSTVLRSATRIDFIMCDFVLFSFFFFFFFKLLLPSICIITYNDAIKR